MLIFLDPEPDASVDTCGAQVMQCVLICLITCIMNCFTTLQLSLLPPVLAQTLAQLCRIYGKQCALWALQVWHICSYFKGISAYLCHFLQGLGLKRREFSVLGSCYLLMTGSGFAFSWCFCFFFFLNWYLYVERTKWLYIWYWKISIKGMVQHRTMRCVACQWAAKP